MIRSSFFFFLLMGLLSSSLYAEKQNEQNEGFLYEFSICAIFRDEAPYLKEWIEFHRMMGAEHFYLFNNNSSDQYLEVLQPYIDHSVVEIIDWPSPLEVDWTPYQEKAYALCLDGARHVTKWLAFLDLDEFLLPLREASVIDFLHLHENAGVVQAYWRAFGTSYVAKIPADKLLTESLVRTHPSLVKGEMCYGKPIIQPHYVSYINIHNGYSDSHETYYAHPGYAEDWNREKVHSTEPELRINHYWTRDQNFLLSVKRERRERYERRPWSDKKIQALLNAYNEEEDHEIFRWLPELRKRIASSDDV